MITAPDGVLSVAADRLLDLLRETPRADAAEWRRLDVPAWEEMLALARRLHVTPLVWSRIRAARLDELIPAAVRGPLQEAYRLNALRNLSLIEQVTHLVRECHRRAVPVILLKGLHVAQQIYDSLADRVVGDIDILVPEDRAADVVAAMRALGYAPASWPALNEAAILRIEKHLPPMVKTNAAPVEIHVSLGLMDRTPQEALAEFWQRARPVSLGPVAPAGLAPEDLLLHLCVHASYQHQFSAGLRPCCDIAAAIRRWGATLDWPAIGDRARRWRWSRGVRLTLEVTRQLLGVALPDGADASLDRVQGGPAAAKMAIAQVFVDARSAAASQVNLARMANEPSLAGKIRRLSQRLFLSPVELAGRYRVSPTSPRRYWYYGVRLIDLLRNHAWAACRLLGGDWRLRAISARTASLADWLADE